MLNPALARETLQETVRKVREGTFPYLPRFPPLRDWSLYDRAQTHEAPDLSALLVSATDTLVERVPTWGAVPGRLPGRPRIPVVDRLRALVWQSYRGMANRPTSSELTLLSHRLRLIRPFSYGTVAHAYHEAEVRVALQALLWMTNEPVSGRERRFAIDGSGLSTGRADHYSSHRGKQRGEGREEGAFPLSNHRPWVRNVANLGMDCGLVAGWKSWVNPEIGELSAFEEVFRMTVALHPGAELQLGDGLYSARWVVGRVAKEGMELRALPRRNTTLKCLGEPAWPKSIWGLVKDPQGWLKEYHERSKVEAFWGALKARNPEKIRKRVAHAQEVEATAKAVVHNLRRLCYFHWVEGMDPEPDGWSLDRVAG